MKKTGLAILSVVMLILACERDYDALEISSGFKCGWCAGSDSLYVTREITRYSSRIPCDNDRSFVEKATVKEDWDNLTSQLDWKQFKKININTCHNCADGCDYWITIHNGSDWHSIQYGQEDSAAVQSISHFIAMIDSVRSHL
jgi:hypothetical protein